MSPDMLSHTLRIVAGMSLVIMLFMAIDAFGHEPLSRETMTTMCVTETMLTGTALICSILLIVIKQYISGIVLVLACIPALGLTVLSVIGLSLIGMH